MPGRTERASSAPHASDPRPDCAATIAPLLSDGGGSDIAAGLALIANLGFRGVQWPATVAGLRPRDLDAGSRRGLRSELRRLELVCSGIDVWIPTGHFLDVMTIDRALTAIEASIALAADLAEPGRDRPVVSTIFPGVAERGDTGHAADELAEALAALSSRAERDGIAIADHAVDAIPTNSATLGVGIDPVACLASNVDPITRVASVGPRLHSARLADLWRGGMRGPVGEPREARLDLMSYRAALDIAGYHRLVVIDARQWRDPAAGLASSLERWAGRPVARPVNRSP